jgi:VanZ family protein
VAFLNGAFLRLWGPALLQMAAIFVASSLPNLKRLPGDVSDHTGHFVGYAMLGALVLRACAGARWDGVTARTSFRAWAICAIYGATDEFHQMFTPGRTPAVDDWVADAVGVAAAIVAGLAARPFLSRGPRSGEV